MPVVDTEITLYNGIGILSPIWLGLYSETEGYLLDYYINVLCPPCSLSTQHNPYLTVLLPVASEFGPLRQALLAAAAHQIWLLTDERFETAALTLKASAISGLRQDLGSTPMDWRHLATMLMLCFYDVSVTGLKTGRNNADHEDL